MRRFLAATTGCGLLIAGATIASAVVLAGIVARVISDPAARSWHALGPSILVLLALWAVRTVAQWLQGRLSQRGASAVIADLADRVLSTAAALPPATSPAVATTPPCWSPADWTAFGCTSPPTCRRCFWLPS